MRCVNQSVVDSQFGWILPSQLSADSEGVGEDSFTAVPLNKEVSLLRTDTALMDNLHTYGFGAQLALVPSIPFSQRSGLVLLAGKAAITLAEVGTVPLDRIRLIVDTSLEEYVDPRLRDDYDIRVEDVSTIPVQYVRGVACQRLDLALGEFVDGLEPVWLFDIIEDLLDMELAKPEDLARVVDERARVFGFDDGMDLVNFCIDPSGHILEYMWAA